MKFSSLSKRLLKIAVVSVVVVVAYFAASGLSTGMQLAFVVFVMAASLWITTAIPLAATSLLIAVSQPLLGIQSFEAALRPFFDPIVVLLLGGFLLALAIEKHDLDEVFAQRIVARFSVDLKMVTLGLMVSTAFLSMWISNTASTAIMMTLALRLTADVKDERGNASKIMVLGIAYSATVGGLATLIGTPSNALAAAMLRKTVGYNLSFFEWFLYGLPLTAILVIVIWLLLFKIFPTDVKELPKVETQSKKLTKQQKITFALFMFAVVLWVTGQLPEPLVELTGWSGHGLSSGIVAAVVAVALFLTGLLDENDLPKVSWNTLLLFGGGLSLGSALEVSGLTGWIGQGITQATGGGGISAIFLLAFSALGFSIVASNTASSSVFIPIAISVGLASGMSPVVLAVLVAICSSLDFMLPVGTPPNAIAYSTGRVKMQEMVKAGVLLDILSALITIFLALFLWSFLV
ncbi:MAG: DASS family sodium-coupled anion symporter [Candidatus Bathyarchaeia archaeon]